MSKKLWTIEDLMRTPYLALPKAVRERAAQRYEALYGRGDYIDQEEAKADLADLSVHRLVNAFKGNVGKAMKHARTHGSGYPGTAIGWSRQRWVKAYERAKQRLVELGGDSAFRKRAQGIYALLLEELNRE